MSLDIQLHASGVDLGTDRADKIIRKVHTLDARLEHFPSPLATVRLRDHQDQRRVEVDLRVELGPHGPSLISHQGAETPDHAVRLAVEDIERQLERRLDSLRGDAAFGVPSRREPRAERPHAPHPEAKPHGEVDWDKL
jgi:hypothetical protein